jgi:hypothetical protein
MWLFTRYGFFSAACAQKKNGAIDKDTIMVRSRTMRHLLNLQKRFSGLAPEILVDSGTDYRYRIIIPKSQWVEVVSEIASEQTWSNFKNEAARFARENGDSTGYVHALHDIWGTMYELQKNEK